MYWAILIICNLPIFFGIGYVLFHPKTGGNFDFWATVAALIKVVLFPRWVRMLFDMETDDAAGMIEIVSFIVLCVAVVAGEHYLIQKYYYGVSRVF